MRRNSFTVPGTRFDASPLIIATVISPRRKPLSSSILACARVISFKVWRTWPIRTSPAAVRISFFGRRWNTGVPNWVSSARICRLMADAATLRWLAALRIDPVLATSST